MKKKLSVVVLVCVIFLILYGCAPKTPHFLPGEHEGDENFVWVCEEPLAYFSLSDDECYGRKCENLLKGYFEKEDGVSCFYSGFYRLAGGVTDFCEAKVWQNHDIDESIRGYADYREDYFDFEVEFDDVNFFDEELPTLRFEKMTKEEFRETYGEERFNRITESEVESI